MEKCGQQKKCGVQIVTVIVRSFCNILSSRLYVYKAKAILACEIVLTIEI